MCVCTVYGVCVCTVYGVCVCTVYGVCVCVLCMVCVCVLCMVCLVGNGTVRKWHLDIKRLPAYFWSTVVGERLTRKCTLH